MRSILPVVVIALLAACNADKRVPANPPRVADKVGELRAYDPRADWMRPNPKPATLMLGCYEIQRPEALRYARDEPLVVQLTDRPHGTYGAWQTYEVWSAGQPLALTSWTPRSDTELEVGLGTGFQGCYYKLKKAGADLRGTGRWWSDVPDPKSPDIAASFRRVSCAHRLPPN